MPSRSYTLSRMAATCCKRNLVVLTNVGETHLSYGGIFNEPSWGCGGEETVLSSGVQSHVSEHITAGGMCVCVAKMQP